MALRTSDILTISAAKTTTCILRSFGKKTVADRHADARLPGWTRDPVALSRLGPDCLCLARSDDDSHQRRHLGGPDPPRGLDTGGGSAHHYDVRHGSDADSIPQAEAGENAASKLLRSQRVAAAERTYSARLQLRNS